MIWRLNQVPVRMARGKGRLKVQELWPGLPEWLPLPAGRLIPAIIRHAASGMVLMLVDLNQEALSLIAATGRVHYYHPAKRKVVAKGEASGHFQDVVEIRLSCGGDQLILKVRPAAAPASWDTPPAFSGVWAKAAGRLPTPRSSTRTKSTRKSLFPTERKW